MYIHYFDKTYYGGYDLYQMTTGVKFERNYSDRDIKNAVRPSFRHELLEYLYYFLRVFLVVSIFFTLIRTFVFVTIGIEGQSMYPSLKDQEVVYLDLLTPRFSDYKRGDIVVVKPPQDIYEEDGKLYIKRVIGLPGESIGFDEGEVYVYNESYPDGIELEESYLEDTVSTYKKVQVAGAGHIEDKLDSEEYYVMGDNRTQSIDSRTFEEVEKGRILGKVFFVLDHDNQSGFFELPEYNINN